MTHIIVDHSQLWVEETGQGVPIVFSHSLFFDSTMFSGQVAEFSPTNRVITYDHRGQGRSHPQSGPAASIDELAQDAAGLIEELGAGPCHFVGNSLGGFVALRLAARRPDLLISCAILGSSGEAEGKLAEFTPLVDGMAANGVAGFVDTIEYIMFGDTFLADPARAAERATWRAHIAALPISIAECARAVIRRADILAELAGCRVPVLALAGAEDHAYSLKEAEAVARACGGRAQSVAQAGHSLALEQPTAVNALLAAHFAAAERIAAA